MTNFSFKNFKCDDIIEAFGETKVEARYNTLLNEVDKFIEVNGLSEKVTVNRLVLANVVTDYFHDIKRLKNFHTDIEKVNSEKVIAYLSYWLLYRKPIQIVNNDLKDKELATVNERFVLQYILNYLSEREKESHILLRNNKGLHNFAKLFLYYLTFRPHTQQCLEMIIVSFLAGQIYENSDEDIGQLLHSYDNIIEC